MDINIVLELAKLISYSSIGIVTSYFITSNNVKYKISKNNNFNKLKIVNSPEFIKRKSIDERKKESKIEIDKNLNEIVNKFINFLNDENRDRIKNNLDTIYIKKSFKHKILQFANGTAATYSPSKHCIVLNDKRDQIINHELLHSMVSGVDNEKRLYTGFVQRDKDIIVGRSINEGCTEYLNRIRFDYDDYIPSYSYEVLVVILLEDIIGDKLFQYYFNTDLSGLINEISKYNSIIEVKQFIVDMDALLDYKKMLYLYKSLSTKDQTECIKLHNRVSKFLYETYSNKMNQELSLDRLDEYILHSDWFITKLEVLSHLLDITLLDCYRQLIIDSKDKVVEKITRKSK